MAVQSAVLKETRNIAIGAVICAVVLIAVAVIIGQFDYTVALGTVLGGTGAVLCFFQLGMTVQKILSTDLPEDEKLKYGKMKIRTSYMMRLVIMAAFFLTSVYVDVFNWVATAVMLLSPRLVVMLLPVCKKLFGRKSSVEEVSIDR